MKNRSFFLFFLFLSPLVKAQNTFVVTGEAPAFKDGDRVFISAKYPFNSLFLYPENEDSSVIENGRFHISLQSSSAEFYLLKVKKRNGKELENRFFLLPSNTKISLNDSSLQHLSMRGNKAADEYVSFSNQLQQLKPPELYNQLFKIYDSTRNINPEFASKIFIRIDSILKLLDERRAIISRQWIADHPSSLLNTYIIYSLLMPVIEDDSLKAEFFNLPYNSRKNSWGKELNYIVNNVIVGALSPAFSQKDTNGNNISLSDFTGKNKYVLLDFWASWCGPCRENNPALKSIYNEFENKRFIIIGISLDNSKQRWKDAIKKDDLKWPQISDLKFWKNEIAQAYYIRSIPSNFLLDSSGKIIAKNVSMMKLQKILNNLLN